MSISTLNIDSSYKDVKGTTSNDTDLYQVFKTFMLDSLYIRYGINEKVLTSRLCSVFNNVMKQDISFNAAFPAFMLQFMKDHSQYNILKKHRKEGIMYIGIGLVTDSVKREREVSITSHERKEAKLQREKMKSERRKLRNRVIVRELRDIIRSKTGWSDIEYNQLINLGFIHMYKNGKEYNITAMIESARANIRDYIYERIEHLQSFVPTATFMKNSFIKATNEDITLSQINEFPTYTERLKAAESTYTVGNKLAREIIKYTDRTQMLPQLDDIVYPDIQHLSQIATWLKKNSSYRTSRDMAINQEDYLSADENVTNHIEIDTLIERY